MLPSPNLSQSTMTRTRLDSPSTQQILYIYIHELILSRWGGCSGGSAIAGQPPAHLGWILGKKQRQNHDQKKQNINRKKYLEKGKFKDKLFEFYAKTTPSSGEAGFKISAFTEDVAHFRFIILYRCCQKFKHFGQNKNDMYTCFRGP